MIVIFLYSATSPNFYIRLQSQAIMDVSWVTEQALLTAQSIAYKLSFTFYQYMPTRYKHLNAALTSPTHLLRLTKAGRAYEV